MAKAKAQASPQAATTEGVTKEECFHIPGSYDWKEYSNQGKVPKQQRKGTCYHEGSGD
ncbi:MAG: hypothetical protein HC769_33040 [Cyanobacteria bacterium CRU_2_1]|nr:hypothetical protein [Cyanobacteria bacterium CRU_2_1]